VRTTKTKRIVKLDSYRNKEMGNLDNWKLRHPNSVNHKNHYSFPLQMTPPIGKAVPNHQLKSKNKISNKHKIYSKYK
jgi:hypothetical protein